MAYTAKLLICDVVSVPSSATAAEAAKAMAGKNIGAVIVGATSRPEGIFTERDLLQRVVGKGLDPRQTKISEVMTRPLVTVDSAAPLNQVFERLAEGRFRHLPIAENGRIVGMVSLSDLAKVLQEVYREDRYLQYFADVIKSR